VLKWFSRGKKREFKWCLLVLNFEAKKIGLLGELAGGGFYR
jgi:hypothetical protein